MKTKTTPPEEVVFIYSLSDPRTGEVRYVGKAFNTKVRLREHLRNRYPCHKTHWIQSLRRIGLSPVLRILETFIGQEDIAWQLAERRWISKLRKAGFQLTNMDSGGETGRHHSEETKAKISAAHLGRRKSDAARANMSRAAKGKKKAPFTPEHKANMSKAFKGRTILPAQREKARINALKQWAGRRAARTITYED